MEIFEIKTLDCTFSRNRKRLVTAVKKALKESERPKRKKLEKVINKISKRYNINPSVIKQTGDGQLYVSIEIRRGVYSTFYSNYYYEALCKYILIAMKHIKYNKEVPR